MRARAFWLVVLVVGLGGMGCGGDDDDGTTTVPPSGRHDAGNGSRRCVDNDDDGFGDFCDDDPYAYWAAGTRELAPHNIVELAGEQVRRAHVRDDHG